MQLAFESAAFGLDPGHQVPWFVVRDDDQEIDDFALEGGDVSRQGLYLDAIAVLSEPRLVLDLQAGTGLLDSTRLLDAVGVYSEGDFGSASFHLADSFWVPLTIAFRELRIAEVEED